MSRRPRPRSPSPGRARIRALVGVLGGALLFALTSTGPLVPTPARAQVPDPLFTGEAPNLWIYGPTRPEPVSVRVGGTPAPRTESAQLQLATVQVTLSNGLILEVPARAVAALTNRVEGSAPAVPGSPAVRVAGYGAPDLVLGPGGALSSPSGQVGPYVAFSPASGTYLGAPVVTYTTVSLDWVAQVIVNVVHSGVTLFTSDQLAGRLPTLPLGTSTVSWALLDAESGDWLSGVETYTVVSPPLTRDTDGDGVADLFVDSDNDGIPDAVELAYGGDPTRADMGRDTDGDGLSDFDELLRGSDPTCAPPATPPGSLPCLPTDTDGDGWSDFDESLRGTDPDNAGCYPAAAGVSAPERIVTLSGVATDRSGAFTAARADGLDLIGLDFSLPAVQRGDGCALPFALGEGTGLSSAARDLSSLSLRVGNRQPLAIRVSGPVRALDGVALVGPGFAAHAVINGVADANPARIVSLMDPRAIGSVAAFIDAYNDLLGPELVLTWSGRPSPRTTLGLALFTELVAWNDGREGDYWPTAGRRLANPPTVAAARVVQRVGRDAEGFVSALTQLFDAGAPLGPLTPTFDALLTADEADTRPADLSFPRAASAPALVELASYLGRLHWFSGLSTIAALDPTARATLFDPANDFDGDGLSSRHELIVRLGDAAGQTPVTVPLALDPTRPDTDGDGIPDGQDPCPREPEDRCLERAAGARDSDGDGIIDALDNCLNLANASQADADLDGRGDACDAAAWIRAPAVHPIVRTGHRLHLATARSALGQTLGANLSMRWTFGGRAPDFLGPNPPPLHLVDPGAFRVELWLAWPGQAEYRADYRDVTVLGARVPVAVGIDLTGTLIEGRTLTFTAHAVSPTGHASTLAWSLGDGQTGTGTTLKRVYAQHGTYTVTATATDSTGRTGAASIQVTIADTKPTAKFSASVDELTLSLESLATAYDGIASEAWDLGDGSPIRYGRTLTHTYARSGRYTVQLTVTDGDGTAVISKKTVVADGYVLQTVAAALDETWQVVTYPREMGAPLVFPSLVNRTSGGTLGVVQVRAVGPVGFEARFAPWPSAPPLDVEVPVTFLVVEAGENPFSDGATWLAETGELAGANADFDTAWFEDPPGTIAPYAVLFAPQTANNPFPVGVRGRELAFDSVELALMQQELDGANAAASETVARLAIWSSIKRGTAIINGAPTNWTATLTKVGSAGRLVGNCNLVLSEDTSLDAETSHRAEDVLLLRFSNLCFGAIVTAYELDPATLDLR